MYGQYVNADGSYGICRPFASKEDFGRMREKWITSHIRTYRAGLFHHIKNQDPEYNCLKDKNGDWLSSAVDAAIMFPLCEMAGFEKVKYNHEILYVYNNTNPHNMSNSKRVEQLVESVNKFSE